jgi:hypothetical protein
MVAAAVAAFAMCGIVASIRLQRLKQHYRALAARHADDEKLYQFERKLREFGIESGARRVLDEEPIGINRDGTPEQRQQRASSTTASEGRLQRQAAQFAARAAYHARLKEKYEQAAAHPATWLEPDPLAPPVPRSVVTPKLPPGFSIGGFR